MFAFTCASAQLNANRPRPRVTSPITALRCAGVQLEPVRLHHRGGTHPSSLSVATATAFAARRDAERRPYRRAHNEVRTSVTSRTKSSLVSVASSTTIRRPHADIDAARCSNPNLVSRSRCATTMTVTAGSDRSSVSLGRCPFMPDPTSDTTLPTAKPRPVASATTRPIWRSRSSFWSAEDTRQYAATMPPTGTGFGAGSTRINRPARRAGTGSFPSRNQRYAVTGCTPCSRAHSFKFTTTHHCLLKGQQLAPPRVLQRNVPDQAL